MSCFCMKIYDGSLLDKGNDQYFWEYWLANIDLLRFMTNTEDQYWQTEWRMLHELRKRLTQLQKMFARLLE